MVFTRWFAIVQRPPLNPVVGTVLEVLCVGVCIHSALIRNLLRRDFVHLLSIHTEELNDLYCSPNTVRVIKSRIIG